MLLELMMEFVRFCKARPFHMSKIQLYKGKRTSMSCLARALLQQQG